MAERARSARPGVVPGRPAGSSLPSSMTRPPGLPAAVYLAATAASRWGGWPEVSRLLTGERWLDSLYEGRGRLLLARAALEAQQRLAGTLRRHWLRRPHPTTRSKASGWCCWPRPSTGWTPATAPPRPTNVPRCIFPASPTGCSSGPLPSPTTAPAGRDCTPGSGMRFARSRIPWSDASAIQRTGDLIGAAQRYTTLGARVGSTSSPPRCQPRQRHARARAAGPGGARRGASLGRERCAKRSRSSTARSHR